MCGKAYLSFLIHFWQILAPLKNSWLQFNIALLVMVFFSASQIHSGDTFSDLGIASPLEKVKKFCYNIYRK